MMGVVDARTRRVNLQNNNRLLCVASRTIINIYLPSILKQIISLIYSRNSFGLSLLVGFLDA